MKNYTNFRITHNLTDMQYELQEVMYDEKGEVIECKYIVDLGATLKDVEETLEGLLSDIRNWVDEEMSYIKLQ